MSDLERVELAVGRLSTVLRKMNDRGKPMTLLEAVDRLYDELVRVGIEGEDSDGD